MNRSFVLITAILALGSAAIPADAASPLGEVGRPRAAALLQLVAAATPAQQEGRRAFLRLNCYGCHGIRGAGGMGPNLRGNDDDVSEVVLNGKDEGMPGYRGRVTSADLANLTAYMRSLGSASEPTFTHWWETVPAR